MLTSWKGAVGVGRFSVDGEEGTTSPDSSSESTKGRLTGRSSFSRMGAPFAWLTVVPFENPEAKRVSK